MTTDELIAILAPLLDEHCRPSAQMIDGVIYARVDRTNPAGETVDRFGKRSAEECCHIDLNADLQSLSPDALLEHLKACIPDSWEFGYVAPVADQ